MKSTVGKQNLMYYLKKKPWSSHKWPWHICVFFRKQMLDSVPYWVDLPNNSRHWPKNWVAVLKNLDHIMMPLKSTRQLKNVAKKQLCSFREHLVSQAILTICYIMIFYGLLLLLKGIHKAAKETIALAEQRFLSHQHEWKFDNAWQEMLNQATMRVFI